MLKSISHKLSVGIAFWSFVQIACLSAFAEDDGWYHTDSLKIPSKSTAEIYGPLKQRDLAELRHGDITLAILFPNAQRHVFGSSKLFRSLRSVQLRRDDIADPLQDLATNYSGLRNLSIEHGSPLIDQNLVQLQKLRRLELFQLSGSTVSNAEIASLSPTLKCLILNHAVFKHSSKMQSITLPNLSELRIYESKVDAKFLDNLVAPKLSRMYFANDTVEAGVLTHLSSQFPKLKYLFLSASKFERNDLEGLRRTCPNLEIYIPSSSSK